MIPRILFLHQKIFFLYKICIFISENLKLIYYNNYDVTVAMAFWPTCHIIAVKN